MEDAIGLDTLEDQHNDTMGANALLHKDFRGSLNLATLVLHKEKTYRFLREKWRHERLQLALIDSAFLEKLPRSAKLATGFRLESSPRRLKNIHINAPVYTEKTNRFHIAQGAFGLHQELLRQSPRILQTLALSNQQIHDVDATLTNLMSYAPLALDQFDTLQQYLFALAAQNVKAVHAVNTDPQQTLYINAHDICGVRNTDEMLTIRDFDDTTETKVWGNPVSVVDTEVIKQSTRTLIHYFEHLRECTPIPDPSGPQYEEAVYFGHIYNSIRTMTDNLL